MASVGGPFPLGHGQIERAGVMNFVGRERANLAGAKGRACRSARAVGEAAWRDKVFASHDESIGGFPYGPLRCGGSRGATRPTPLPAQRRRARGRHLSQFWMEKVQSVDF